MLWTRRKYMRITHWCTAYNKKLEKRLRLTSCIFFIEKLQQPRPPHASLPDFFFPILARNIHLSIKLQPVTQLHIVSLDVAWFIFFMFHTQDPSSFRQADVSRMKLNGAYRKCDLNLRCLSFSFSFFFFTPVSVRKIYLSPQSGSDVMWCLCVRVKRLFGQPQSRWTRFSNCKTLLAFFSRGSSVRIHHL